MKGDSSTELETAVTAHECGPLVGLPLQLCGAWQSKA